MAAGHLSTGKPLVNRVPFLDWELRTKTNFPRPETEETPSVAESPGAARDPGADAGGAADLWRRAGPAGPGRERFPAVRKAGSP